MSFGTKNIMSSQEWSHRSHLISHFLHRVAGHSKVPMGGRVPGFGSFERRGSQNIRARFPCSSKNLKLHRFNIYIYLYIYLKFRSVKQTGCCGAHPKCLRGRVLGQPQYVNSPNAPASKSDLSSSIGSLEFKHGELQTRGICVLDAVFVLSCRFTLLFEKEIAATIE